MEISRRNFLKNSAGAALMIAAIPATSTLISCNQTAKKMNEQALTVVALLETSAEKADELKKVCLGLIEPSRKDEGCISYELYQDTTNPGKFTFIEKWKSKELLDAHLKAPHLVAAAEVFGKILIKELQVILLDKIA
jgi:quinol monooxygenase YgiN